MNKNEHRRAVFLDRDGTIVEEAVYLHREEDVVVFNGVASALKQLRDAGYLLFIVTNQSGIGRGYFTEADMQRVHRFLLGLLSKDDATIDGVYVCPHHPDDNCDCRKPSPKFLLDAAAQYSIDLAESFMIGDKMIDVETAHRAGARGILVQTGYGKEVVNKAKAAGESLAADFVAKDLPSAADWILNQNLTKP